PPRPVRLPHSPLLGNGVRGEGAVPRGRTFAKPQPAYNKLMHDLEQRILAAVAAKSYHPLKPKALARKLEHGGATYETFKKAVKSLIHQGRLELGKGNAIRPVAPHGTVTGTFRKSAGGFGFVRPHPVAGNIRPDIR